MRLLLEAESLAPLDLRHRPPPPSREIPLEKHCPPAALRAVAVPARMHTRVVPESSYPKLNPFPAAAALSWLSQPLGFRCQRRCHRRSPAVLVPPCARFLLAHCGQSQRTLSPRQGQSPA